MSTAARLCTGAAALGREPGRHTHVDLRTEIGRLREDGHLVAAGDGALTTRRTLRAEKEMVRRMRDPPKEVQEQTLTQRRGRSHGGGIGM